MFLTRKVTADIFSTFTAHLTAATNNIASHARFLQRYVTKFETRFRQKDETYAQRNQRLDFGSRAPALFVEITVHLSTPLSRRVLLTCRSNGQRRLKTAFL